MKDHILVVEDNAILYKRLKAVLTQENYSVSNYCPSYQSALAEINRKRPDLALLDIDLSGEKTGLDLGEQLSKTYSIPFIYVTSYGDNNTFFKGLNTNHENFIVKTKPTLNATELIRAILTVFK